MRPVCFYFCLSVCSVCISDLFVDWIFVGTFLSIETCVLGEQQGPSPSPFFLDLFFDFYYWKCVCVCLREIDREWLCIYINKGVCVFVCVCNERTRKDSFHALADNAECAFFYAHLCVYIYADYMRVICGYYPHMGPFLERIYATLKNFSYSLEL